MKRLILTSAWYCARIGRSSLARRERGAEGVSTHATKCRRPRMGASGAGGARVKHTGFRRHGAQSEAEHAMDMAVGRPSCANKLSRRDKRAVGPERVASRRGRRHGSAWQRAERLHFLFAQSRPAGLESINCTVVVRRRARALPTSQPALPRPRQGPGRQGPGRRAARASLTRRATLSLSPLASASESSQSSSSALGQAAAGTSACRGGKCKTQLTLRGRRITATWVALLQPREPGRAGT